MDFLGSAAFSRAVQALDVKTRRLVCLKIIKNNKDYFDQSLDEIKLLSYINSADPMDEHGLLRLYDYFYYKVRPALICFRLWSLPAEHGKIGLGRWSISAACTKGLGLAPVSSCKSDGVMDDPACF